MKTGLIISEYNPFHNGHRHQIETFRKESSVSHIVTFMSGNFVQRGTPAIFDKYFRAELAVRGGCDLVLELPVQYAVSSAEFFGKGAILCQRKTHIADAISFGTETGNTDDLIKIAKVLRDRKTEADELIKGFMKEGELFPKARERAAASLLNQDISGIFSPNNILALEYIRAIMEYDVNMEIHTLKRSGLGYHDTYSDEESESDTRNPSATAIRKLIGEGKDIEGLVPDGNIRLIREYLRSHSMPDEEKLFHLFRYRLLTDGKSVLDLSDAGDGLGERILNARENIDPYGSIEGFVQAVKTKRYTYTRIRRLMLQFTMFLDRTDYERAKRIGPEYIKILAFNERGAEILKKASAVSEIPIIHSLKTLSPEQCDKDHRASALYSLLSPQYDRLSDYTHMFSPIV